MQTPPKQADNNAQYGTYEFLTSEHVTPLAKMQPGKLQADAAVMIEDMRNPGTYQVFDLKKPSERPSNRCTECGVDMGDCNPRQLCGKTVCRNPMAWEDDDEMPELIDDDARFSEPELSESDKDRTQALAKLQSRCDTWDRMCYDIQHPRRTTQSKK